MKCPIMQSTMHSHSNKQIFEVIFTLRMRSSSHLVKHSQNELLMEKRRRKKNSSKVVWIEDKQYKRKRWKLPLNKHFALIPHAADGLAIKMRRAARSISFMFMLNKIFQWLYTPEV